MHEATPLYEDNQACIKLSTNPIGAKSRKTTHIDSRYHFLREQVVHARTLKMVYVDTSDQVADALTKGLPVTALRRFRDAMCGRIHITPPDPNGDAGRIGHSLTDPIRFPSLESV